MSLETNHIFKLVACGVVKAMVDGTDYRAEGSKLGFAPATRWNGPLGVICCFSEASGFCATDMAGFQNLPYLMGRYKLDREVPAKRIGMDMFLCAEGLWAVAENAKRRQTFKSLPPFWAYSPALFGRRVREPYIG